ncbi:DUF2147 domain-containing protein [Tropicimonas sp. IMCC34011]|uniref:DUF2147 domain-containing protein n=1 Tax=Tropicimonas sp. IMCC34011 TaxID=2248759 RepID=UPI000E248DE8|nr:DUF2147 domain-containing protein [Tropicimonas sp. IMCC34011]
MKRLAFAAAALALSAVAAFADPVEGTWKTEPGDDGAYAHVVIRPCGANICGVIARGFDAGGTEIQSKNIGARMIWDMTADGGGSYSGGKIWAPDRDKVYRSKMELSGNSLKVSGCVGPICRGQNWVRVQ